jgi:hypothetical protein
LNYLFVEIWVSHRIDMTLNFSQGYHQILRLRIAFGHLNIEKKFRMQAGQTSSLGVLVTPNEDARLECRTVWS